MRHLFDERHGAFFSHTFEFEKGGGAMPPQETEASKAQARIMEEEAREKREAARTKREEKERKRQEARDIEDSNFRVGRAYDSSVSDALSRLASSGLDSNSGYGAEIANLVRANLNRSRAGAPKIVTDANSLFSPTAYDDAYSTVRNTARGKLSRQANEFMGEGFETEAFADTADDEILRSILGDQESELEQRIQQARARGQINDAGMSRAMKDFGNAKSAAWSRANTLGMGVLSDYRKRLGDFAGRQRSRIDNYDFADNINLDNIRTQLDSKAGSLRDSLQGDILAAIGGTSFFDADKILGAATGASGVMNNTQPIVPTTPNTSLTNPLTASLTDRAKTNNVGDRQENMVF